MTVYEIAEQYHVLLEMAEDGDIDEQTLQDTLESLEGDIKKKLNNLYFAMQEYEAMAKAKKDEIAKLKARVEADEKSAARIKGLAEWLVNNTDDKRIKTDLFTFKMVGNGGLQPLWVSADCDLEAIDDRFVKVKTEKVLNTEEVRKALANNEELLWAKLMDRGQRLSVK